MKTSNQQLFSSPWTILYLPKYSPVALAWNSNVLKEGLFLCAKDRMPKNSQPINALQTVMNRLIFLLYFLRFHEKWILIGWQNCRAFGASVSYSKIELLIISSPKCFPFLIFANWLNWQHLNFNYSSWHNFCRTILTVLSI